MRILIFTDAWKPQVNGVVRTLSTTMSVLKKMGHDVLIVSPQDFLHIPKTITKHLYPDVDFAFPPIFKIARIIKKFKPDAIHISTEGPIGWAAWATCLFRGMKFTTTYHTKFPEYIKKSFKVPLWIGYIYERLFHNGSYRIMVATPSLMEELSSHRFKRLSIWARGVDTDLFTPDRKDPNLYPAEHRPVSLYFGRVAKEKNIDAFLSSEWAGTKYVVGDGPELETLKKNHPDAVFLGKKTGVELVKHVASADITVFPSYTDTFGLTIIESMSCGVPVAAYDATGPKDIIKQLETGCFDKESLSNAMLKAFQTKDSEKCRQYALSQTWEMCTQQFVDNLENDKSNIEVCSSPTTLGDVVRMKLSQMWLFIKRPRLKKKKGANKITQK